MKIKELKEIIICIYSKINENKDYLTKLDQESGDGDLGISMVSGFQAMKDYMEATEETDLGRVLNKCGDVFNEAAPSSLGTILTFFLKGMAKKMKGCSECDLDGISEALQKGIENIMKKAGSKPGEKTILDSLFPAVQAMKSTEVKEPAKEAAIAAKMGCEKTREMKAVWGRAAYYGEKSFGVLDGGAVVGALIFEAVNEWKNESLLQEKSLRS